ncbi:FecR family protein [Maribellus maritimus]|uniref:FecR family protein n=1 Tax=Maribellus maritimus TaxID=2870838 RepID=UPI001EEB1CFB|nr:FecR domain-containing protein [Maribellus maritimus]MCG6189716.1 FecR domain-containing protein [Maribellus maritimus]
MNQKTNIEQLIARHLNGESTSSDRETFKIWLESSEENRKLFYQTKDTWDASVKEKDNSKDALLHFYKRQASQNSSFGKTLYLWKTIAGVAAVIAVVFFSAFLFNMFTRGEEVTGSKTELVSFKVPMGSRSQVNLPDGTNVILNSGSELKYQGVFTNKNREVSLSGEAFFMVKSDKEHPFIVKTSDLNVEVTGTQFNICSYADDSFSKVSLLEGKVRIQLEQGEPAVGIVPGQQLYLNKEERKYSVSESDVDIESSWKEGEFRFKEIAFPELIKRLERWYDVRLTYTAPQLKEMLYSGNFRNQESIWQVLDALKLTTPIDYEKTGFRKFEIRYKAK